MPYINYILDDEMYGTSLVQYTEKSPAMEEIFLRTGWWCRHFHLLRF